MKHFPFDEQTCNLTFRSWLYHNDTVDLKRTPWMDIRRHRSRTTLSYDTVDLTFSDDQLQNIDLSSYAESSEWELVTTYAVRSFHPLDGHIGYHDLTYSIVIRRRNGFFIYVLIVPSLLLSILIPGVFWIPPSRTDRTALGMSLFSSFFVLLLILVNTLPSSAIDSKLGLYYCCTMSLIALSTILSTIIIYMSHNYGNKLVPDIMEKMFIGCSKKLSRRKVFIPSHRTDSQPPDESCSSWCQTAPEVDQSTTGLHWNAVATALDRIFFVLSVAAVAIAIGVIFPRRC